MPLETNSINNESLGDSEKFFKDLRNFIIKNLFVRDLSVRIPYQANNCTNPKFKEIKIKFGTFQVQDIKAEDLVELPEGATAEFDEGNSINKVQEGEQIVTIVVQIGDEEKKIPLILRVDTKNNKITVKERDIFFEDKFKYDIRKQSDEIGIINVINNYSSFAYDYFSTKRPFDADRSINPCIEDYYKFIEEFNILYKYIINYIKNTNNAAVSNKNFKSNLVKLKDNILELLIISEDSNLKKLRLKSLIGNDEQLEIPDPNKIGLICWYIRNMFFNPLSKNSK